jgi:peptidyl-prolyl cis-trans isomerase A (cyclophilin A)
MTTARRVSFLLLCVLVIAAPTLFGQAEAPAKKSAAAKAPAKAAANLDPALLNPALAVATAPEKYKVRFDTTAGPITIDVTRAWAPLGADRFYNLAKHHFFDGAAFFRVVPNFVIQFGISADPRVTVAWEMATIKDDPVKQSNHRGYVTFAMGGKNTRTTQLFINLAGNSRLDSMGFSAFGLVEDMANVDKIYTGYGEMAEQGGRGPSAGRLSAQGHAYLDANFPKLDKILSTAVEEPPAATPAKAPAKSGAKAPAKSPAP